MAEELTVYPDAHVESTSVDGYVEDYTPNQLWADKVANNGSTDDDASDYLYVLIQAGGDTDRWTRLARSILLFDTSALPNDCTITSAVLTVYGYAKIDSLGISPTINVYASDPVSDVALAYSTDFDTLGSTPFCDTAITYANFNTGTPGDPNTFTLNDAGETAISKTGITKLGLREATYDVTGDAPAWTADLYAYLIPWSVDKGTTYRPKLVITYEEAPVGIPVQAFMYYQRIRRA